MKTVGLILLTLLLVLLIGGWVTRPRPLAAPVTPLVLKTDADAHLAAGEARAAAEYGLVEGAGKRIVWAGAPGARTEYAVVYLHGFSATRREIAPIPEQVAGRLGANLYEARLAGHGRLRHRLTDVPAEAWLEDGAEALAVGRSLGDKLIVLGVSTGATLALAMARHPDFAAVDTLVLLSPNFDPAATGSGIATGPYGPQLTRLVAGPTHSWDAANELQEKYWTTSYPTASIVEMMRLVDLANALLPEAAVPNALLIYSPQDDVVSIPSLRSGFDHLPATRKQIHTVDEPASLSAHVFAGEILGPEEVEPAVERIVAFIAPE